MIRSGAAHYHQRARDRNAARKGANVARKRTSEQVSGPAGDKKTTGAHPAARGGGRVKRDHVKVTHMFTREQAEVLRREAYRRAEEKGSRKPDESEVVREAVDLWISKHRG